MRIIAFADPRILYYGLAQSPGGFALLTQMSLLDHFVVVSSVKFFGIEFTLAPPAENAHSRVFFSLSPLLFFVLSRAIVFFCSSIKARNAVY